MSAAQACAKDIALGMVHSLSVQEKLYYLRSLDDDTLDAAIAWMVAEFAAHAALKSVYGWQLDLIQACRRRESIEPVVAEALARGFLTSMANVPEQCAPMLRNCTLVWAETAAQRFVVGVELICSGWSSRQSDSASQGEILSRAVACGLLRDPTMPAALLTANAEPLLLAPTQDLTNEMVWRSVAAVEAQRLRADGEHLLAVVLVATVGITLVSSDTRQAQQWLIAALDFVRDVESPVPEIFAVLALLRNSGPENIAEIDGWIAGLIESQIADAGVDGLQIETLRMMAGILIGLALRKQSLDEQDGAFADYSLAIDLYERAAEREDELPTVGTRLSLATAYMNRGNVWRALADPDIDLAIADYVHGIEMKEALAPEAESLHAMQVHGDLAIGYQNMTQVLIERHGEFDQWLSARGDEEDDRAMAIPPWGPWRDKLIDKLSFLLDAGWSDSDQVFRLARLLVDRANDGLHALAPWRVQRPLPEWVIPALDSALADLDRAIPLFERADRDSDGWIVWQAELAKAHRIRAHALRLHESGTADARLVAIDAALSIWENLTLRWSVPDCWLDAVDEKAQVLIELECHEDAAELVENAFAEKRRLLENFPEEAPREALLTSGIELAINGVIALIKAARPRDALLLLYRHSGLRSVSRAKTPWPGDDVAYSALCSLVPPGGALVVPLVTDSETHIIALAGDGRIGAIDLGHSISNNIRIFSLMPLVMSKSIIGGESGQNWNTLDEMLGFAGMSLWTGFVRPIWELVDTKLGLPAGAPVTFVTTGVLDYTPLHAAAREEADGMRFAIEDRVIRYAPGLSFLEAMRDARAEAGRPIRVFGFFDPLGDLPCSRYLERGRIEAALASDNFEAREGCEATAARFLETLRDWASVDATDLHISTHCANVLGDPKASHLIFLGPGGEPEKIEARALMAMTPVKGLAHVCLASCTSGVPDIGRSSEEPCGLIASFIALGAGSVLSSLYPLLDRPAAELVAAIYSRRTAGEELAEALRNEICQRLARARGAGQYLKPSEKIQKISPELSDLIKASRRSEGELPKEVLERMKVDYSEPRLDTQMLAWRRGEAIFPLSWWAGLKAASAG